MTTPGLCVRSLGVPVAVTFTGKAAEGVRRRCRELWRRSLADEVSDAAASVELPIVGSDDLLWGDRLASAITLAAIDARAGELLMVHACGVAEPGTGRVVALVGPSGRGKTTAAMTLGRVWGYVSDETVGIDGQGRVYPHPKPLSVLQGPGAKRLMSPDALALAEPPSELTLGRVVLLEREPERTAPPEVEAVPLTEALAVLTGEMSHLRAWPAPLSTLARVLAATGGPLRVRYREADELVALLPTLLSHARRDLAWSVEGGVAPADAGAGASMGAGRVGRGAFREAVHDDAGTALFLDGAGDARVLLLRGVGPTLWAAAERPGALDQLVEAVLSEHGWPGQADPRELVGSAVAALLEVGALVEVGAGDRGRRVG